MWNNGTENKKLSSPYAAKKRAFLQTRFRKQKQCLSDRKTYGILSARVLSINGKRCVFLWFVSGRKALLLGPPFQGKGGWLMVTYSDSIQLGLLIVAIIGLVLKIIEMDRNHRQ